MALRVSSIKANSVVLSWDDPPQTASFQQVQWSAGNDGIYVSKAISDRRIRTWTITGLRANTLYGFRHRYWYNSRFNTSGTVTATTAMQAVTKLSSPANFRVTTTGRGQTSIQVQWDAVTNATSYQVRRDNGAWSTATSPHTFTGLRADTEYDFAVRALANGFTTSDASTLTASTLTATTDPDPPDPPDPDPPDPGPDPPDPPDPLVPVMEGGLPYLRGSNFSWTITKADNTTVNLNAARISFEFSYGANSTPRQPPLNFGASGRMLLANNSGWKDAELRTWRRLEVKAGANVLLKLLVQDYDIDHANHRVTLTLETASARWYRQEFEFAIAPTQSQQFINEDKLKPSGVSVTVPANVTRWGIQTVGIVEPGRETVLNFSGGSFLRSLAAHASAVLIERPNVNAPSFFLIPMPLSGARDKRTASHTFTTANTTVLLAGHRERSTHRWQADVLEYTWNRDPYKKEDADNVSISKSSDKRGTVGFGPSDYIQGNNVELHEFAGLISYNIDWAERNGTRTRLGTSPTSDGVDYYHQQEGNTIFIRPKNRSSLRVRANWKIQLDVVFWQTKDGTPRAATVSANTPATKRKLPRSQFWHRDPSQSSYGTKLQNIIEAWDDWNARFARFTILPADFSISEADGIVDKYAGSVVNINIGGINNACLLTRVAWKAADDLPLEVTWDVVAFKAIGGGGSADNFILFENLPLQFQSEYLELGA